MFITFARPPVSAGSASRGGGPANGGREGTPREAVPGAGRPEGVHGGEHGEDARQGGHAHGGPHSFADGACSRLRSWRGAGSFLWSCCNSHVVGLGEEVRTLLGVGFRGAVCVHVVGFFCREWGAF